MNYEATVINSFILVRARALVYWRAIIILSICYYRKWFIANNCGAPLSNDSQLVQRLQSNAFALGLHCVNRHPKTAPHNNLFYLLLFYYQHIKGINMRSDSFNPSPRRSPFMWKRCSSSTWYKDVQWPVPSFFSLLSALWFGDRFCTILSRTHTRLLTVRDGGIKL